MTKQRMFAASLGVTLALLFSTIAIGKTLQTENEEKQWFEQKLEAHLKHAKKVSSKLVQLSFEGLCPESVVEVKVGDEFCKRQDHHANSSFKLIQIQGKKLLIQYESKFDHSSFGEDLQTVDTGLIEIPFVLEKRKKQ